MAPVRQPATARGAATRAFLIQAAADLFAERGFGDTTMAELIARSGLTKGAFYFHFSSKEDLALAVIDAKQRQWLEHVQHTIEARPAAADQLRALPAVLVRLDSEDGSAFSFSRLIRDLARLAGTGETVREHMNNWLRFMSDLVVKAQAEGSVDPSIRADDFAVVLLAAIDGLKDLGAIIDDPDELQKGYRRRMKVLTNLIEAITDPSSRGQHA